MDSALNALGFALLIAAFVLFRGWIRRRRREAAGRFYRAIDPRRGPAGCPNCAAPVAAGAAFCARCGAALPPPLPLSRRGGGRRVVAYFVIAVLAVIALSALKTARHTRPRGAPAPFRAPLFRQVLP